MAKDESRLNIFYDQVSEVIQKQLAEMDKRIAAIDGSYSRGDIVTILSEANSLIYYASGQNEDIYEEWRFRLFQNPETGNMTIIQGNEIDVDFKGLIKSSKPKAS